MCVNGDNIEVWIYDGTDWITNKIPVVVDNLTTDSAVAALSARQGKVLNEKFSVKFQEFDQQVAITTQAGVEYYSSGITLNVPNGYTPIGIQWINNWVNMAIPLFRAYSNNDNIYLYFMCSTSITSGFHFKVIYAPKG